MASSPLNTQSGPALIEIYKYPTVDVGGIQVANYSNCFHTGTYSSASTTYATAFGKFAASTPPTPNIVIRKENQFQDAKVTIGRDQFEHKTQASSKASKYIITGIELMLQVSIANITTEFFEEVFSTSAITGTVSSVTHDSVYIKDNAGQELEGALIRVKPYVGANVGTNMDSFVNLLAGTPVDINNTDLTYGLQTQRQLSVTYYALPFYHYDPSGANDYVRSTLDGTRVVFGGLPNESGSAPTAL